MINFYSKFSSIRMIIFRNFIWIRVQILFITTFIKNSNKKDETLRSSETSWSRVIQGWVNAITLFIFYTRN